MSAVVEKVLWPSQIWICFIGTPLLSRRLAQVCPYGTTNASQPEPGQTVRADAAQGEGGTTVTKDTTVGEVIANPALGDFGRLLFPVDRAVTEDMTLAQVSSSSVYVWYSHIQADKTVEIVGDVISRAEQGEQVFYPIYTEAEINADPSRRDTGLFFFRGEPGEKFAVVNAGGGFMYVGAMHDSFPHALELSKMGYNAFALIYRPDDPYTDLARAIAYIYDHADELQVDPDGYSLWGGSAGARMAAELGNGDAMVYFGRPDIPQAAAVIMQYTGYTAVSEKDAPTYVCVGTSDGIASWRAMQSRLEGLEALGIPTEFHAYEGLGHGFGLGTGTVAEGWIEDAAKFWEGQAESGAPSGDTVATAAVTPHEQQTLYLWEEGNAPAVTEYTVNNGNYSDDPDFRPYLTFYPVPDGTAIKGAVLICPGGAFMFRSDGPEGVSVAQALSGRGYQSFVVDYRLRPYTQQEGALDLARAVRFVRAHAGEYGIDEKGIAVMGFSAGGILAGEMLLHWDGTVSPDTLDPGYVPDGLDKVSADAAADGMIYSFYGRLSVGTTDVELLRSGNLPPTFYCYGTRDPFYQQFLANADAAERAGVWVERLQLDNMPHGFGAMGGWVPAYNEFLAEIFRSN